MPIEGHETTRRIIVTNTADEFWVADKDEAGHTKRWVQVRLTHQGDHKEVMVSIEEEGKEMEVHTIPFEEFFDQFKSTFFPGY